MSQTIAAPVETDVDPARFFWYGVWFVIMVATALPMLDIVRVPRVLPYTATLVIHELMAFLYFGHTFFSNIWSLVIRKTQPQPVGVWARGFLRKLCLGVTAPTAVIVPLMGLMLMEDWGGLVNNPWAWDAYFAFWLMAGFSVVPDVIRYARNRNAGNPMHGMNNDPSNPMMRGMPNDPMHPMNGMPNDPMHPSMRSMHQPGMPNDAMNPAGAPPGGMPNFPASMNPEERLRVRAFFLATPLRMFLIFFDFPLLFLYVFSRFCAENFCLEKSLTFHISRGHP